MASAKKAVNGAVKPPPTISAANAPITDLTDPQQPVDTEVIQFPLKQSTGFAQGMSIYGANMNWPRYNPDILLTRQGYEVYDKMVVDEQVKAVLEFKQDAITSRNWAFVFDQGDAGLSDEEQKNRIDVMTQLVEKMQGSFTDGLMYIMRAMRHGYSITEKIFDLVEVDGKAYYSCVELRPKPPYSFYFKTDEYGTLTEFGQNYGGIRRPLDIRKFIHYVQKPEEDRWFGRSELRAAYRSWYAKDVLIKMQNLWAERMAGGFLVVEPDPAAPDITQTDLNMLASAIGNVKTIGGLLLPKGYKAQMIQASGTGFLDLVEHHDLAIAKAMLVPNLLGLSQAAGRTGSFAQSQTQFEAFLRVLQADASRLEAAINEQLFSDFGAVNFADGIVPMFRFESANAEFTKWVVTTWQGLTGANVVVNTEQDEAHIRSMLSMPSRDASAVPLITPQQEMQQKNAEATIAAKGAATDGKGSKPLGFTRDEPMQALWESMSLGDEHKQKADALKAQGKFLLSAAHSSAASEYYRAALCFKRGKDMDARVRFGRARELTDRVTSMERA